jgi:hypothetical protein
MLSALFPIIVHNADVPMDILETRENIAGYQNQKFNLNADKTPIAQVD